MKNKKHLIDCCMFSIKKEKIDPIQTWLLLHHNECANSIGHDGCVIERSDGTYNSGWVVVNCENEIYGFTTCDHFNMESYFKLCNIDAKIKS